MKRYLVYLHPHYLLIQIKSALKTHVLGNTPLLYFLLTLLCFQVLAFNLINIRVPHYFFNKNEHGGADKKEYKRLPHFPVWGNSKLALCHFYFCLKKDQVSLDFQVLSRCYVIIFHHQKPKWFPWQLPPQNHHFFCNIISLCSMNYITGFFVKIIQKFW